MVWLFTWHTKRFGGCGREKIKLKENKMKIAIALVALIAAIIFYRVGKMATFWLMLGCSGVLVGAISSIIFDGVGHYRVFFWVAPIATAVIGVGWFGVLVWQFFKSMK